MHNPLSWAGFASVLALAATAAGCSTDNGAAEVEGERLDAGTSLITIENQHFTPDNLDVRPGSKVVVRNLDNTMHSATSEDAVDAFIPAAVGHVGFDTGLFDSGERSFNINTDATVGTVVHYFCRFHTAEMNQPTITIVK